MVMKVKFTQLLRGNMHAAVIKSPSGCLLRKQIAVIIPTCHPLTVLKHPSIRPCWNILWSKQNPLSTSLSRTITPTVPFLLPCSLHTFHSSWCVNCLQERQQRWQTLGPHEDDNSAHDTQSALLVGWINHKTSHGLFLDFGHTAGWLGSDTGVKRKDYWETSFTAFWTRLSLSYHTCISLLSWDMQCANMVYIPLPWPNFKVT